MYIKAHPSHHRRTGWYHTVAVALARPRRGCGRTGARKWPIPALVLPTLLAAVASAPVRGDDGMWLDELAVLQRCFSGAHVVVDVSCDATDNDGDLDVDLTDFRRLWCRFAGRDFVLDTDGDGVDDCFDECLNDPGRTEAPCDAVRAAIVIAAALPQDKLERSDLPANETEFLENKCVAAQVWVRDVSRPEQRSGGINCVFVDLELGHAQCPVRTIRPREGITDLFPLFQSAGVQNDPAPAVVIRLGGCADRADVGRSGWALLSSFALDTPDSACEATVTIAPSDTPASLVGVSEDLTVAAGPPVDLRILERGTLYDLDGDQFVGPGDLALFVDCWLAVAPLGHCQQMDFDCDDAIGPGDLSYFSTGWLRDVDDPRIIIPGCQVACPDDGATAATVVIDADLLEKFGLPAPPTDWPGW